MNKTIHRKTRCLLLLAAALPFLLGGCGKLVVEPPQEAGGSLVVAVAATGSVSRTIAPATLTVAELSNTANYKLVLTARNHYQTLQDREVALAANGTAVVPGIPDGTWHLTLTAWNAAGTIALMSGHTTVTVRGPGARAHFELTPLGITGTGTLNLTVNWNATDSALLEQDKTKGRYVRIGLFHPGTETQVAGTTAAEWNRDPGHTGTIGMSLSYRGVNGPGTPQIPAGEYELRFWGWGGGIPDGVTLVWKDNLYIEPGRTTTATLTIPQLAAVPEAPRNFVGTATAISGGGGYTSSLGWESVYNAAYYVVEMLKYSVGTVPNSDSTWNSFAGRGDSELYTFTGAGGDANSYASSTHPARKFARVTSGGLLGPSTRMDLDMRLSSGYSYAVRIKSVNYYGASSWSYLSNSLTPDAPTAPSDFSYECYPEFNGVYRVDFTWDRGLFDGGGSHELEIMEYSATGFVTDLGSPVHGQNLYKMTVNDNTWAAVGADAGSVGWSYTAATIGSATGTVAYGSSGGLGAEDEGLSVSITRSTNKFYCARFRTRNSTGQVSPWLYLDTLIMPGVFVSSHVSSEQKNINGYQRWQSNMVIAYPEWGESTDFHWIRLPADRSLTEFIGNDAAWENWQRTDGQGRRNYGGKTTPYLFNELDLDRKFCVRVRTRSPQGMSAWQYYEYEMVQKAP